MLGALALTWTAGDESEPETAAAVEALITGQVANFTLNREAKPTATAAFADADGRAASFADFRGKVVLVNVWATWCAPCVREMPTLARLEAALGGEDFAVVAIAVDRQGMPAVARFYGTHGIANLPPFVDPSYAVPRALGVVGLPTTVLLDRAGPRDRPLGRRRRMGQPRGDRADPPLRRGVLKTPWVGELGRSPVSTRGRART